MTKNFQSFLEQLVTDIPIWSSFAFVLRILACPPCVSPFYAQCITMCITDVLLTEIPTFLCLCLWWLFKVFPMAPWDNQISFCNHISSANPKLCKVIRHIPWTGMKLYNSTCTFNCKKIRKLTVDWHFLADVCSVYKQQQNDDVTYQQVAHLLFIISTRWRQCIQLLKRKMTTVLKQ